MAHLIPEVAEIRALHSSLRNEPLPDETTAVIDMIHKCLRVDSDVHGWRHVDWRSGGRGPSGSGRGGDSRSNYRGFGSRYNNYDSSRRGQGAQGSHGAQSAPLGNDPLNPANVIVQPVVPDAVAPSKPYKYVSIFKKESADIDGTILNTIILGKLNKFNLKNFEEIKGFLCQILDSGETAFLKGFMKLVFQKATTEEVFCPLYARLLSELSDKYKILLTEMVILYKEYMAIFEEVTEKGVVDYDEFVEQNVQKKYRLGYSQFLAELVKYNILDNELLFQTIRTIIKYVPIAASSSDMMRAGEEYADCLQKIIFALISGKITDEICVLVKDEVSSIIRRYTVKGPENKLSMKARFALLDICERIDKVCA